MYKACCWIRAILHGRGLPQGVECTTDCAWRNLCLFHGSACKDCEVNWFVLLIIFLALWCLGMNFLKIILLDSFWLTLIFIVRLQSYNHVSRVTYCLIKWVRSFKDQLDLWEMLFIKKLFNSKQHKGS